jgi:excisionase family DNA binding protein
MAEQGVGVWTADELAEILLDQLRWLRTHNGTRDYLDGERFMTVAEVAGLLAMSRSTVATWARRGAIPAFSIGGRLRFRETEMLDWLEERRLRLDPDGRPRRGRPPGARKAKSATPSEQRLLTAAQVAHVAGVTPATVLEWVETQKLSPVTTAHGEGLRFRESEVVGVPGYENA